MKKPVTVTITGAAGNIGYALAFRVASGQMLGTDQPINLNLLEIPAATAAVQGVVMELNDCAFPVLNKVTATSDAAAAFKDCNFGMLVGARPRGPGMERKDLLLENAKIFSAQGRALDAVASREVKVLPSSPILNRQTRWPRKSLVMTSPCQSSGRCRPLTISSPQCFGLPGFRPFMSREPPTAVTKYAPGTP